jgi:hypothetical protein
MIVVSDTSALSNLALVNHLWLLEAIYETVIVPEVVASELATASNPIQSFQPFFNCAGFKPNPLPTPNSPTNCNKAEGWMPEKPMPLH